MTAAATQVVAGPVSATAAAGVAAWPSRVLHLLAELGWFAAFVLAIPVAVLAVGIPIALVVRLVLALFHVR